MNVLKSISKRNFVFNKQQAFQSLWLYEQKRTLNVHEHISYKLLSEAGLPVPKHGVAINKNEIAQIAKNLNTSDIVLKAQVLTGGRGKGKFTNGLHGGVKLVFSPEEAEQIGSKMLGETLITKQTGDNGIKCEKLMIAERKFVRKEYYLCVMLERSYGGPVFMVSSEGGVEIEQVAAENPKAIHYYPIDIVEGVKTSTTDGIAEKLGLSKRKDEIAKLVKNMYDLFIKSDAMMVEVNPLIEDPNGAFCCLDAKLRFDDSASFRHKELFGYRDFSQEDQKEVAATKYGLNYISLDGSIGCMVNGAGLAMATCDIIKLHGGSPANFLDVGGGSDVEAIREGFRIILTDKRVDGVFVNIFGGIMRCDIIAQGILDVLQSFEVQVPIVVRLQGTNVEQARKLLKASSNIKLLSVDDFDQAALNIVHLSQIVKMARETAVKIHFEYPSRH